MAYFWATRPIMALFGFLLTLVSFRIQPNLSIPPGFDWLCSFVVLVICCSTMVQNDYVDRIHDRKKGKLVVSENAPLFLRYTIGWWIIASVLSLELLHYSVIAFLLALSIYLLGITYHWSYLIRGQALMVVAITAALTTLFPICLSGASISTVCSLTWIVFCLILGREQCKDREDTQIDLGYKETIATAPNWPTLMGATKVFGVSWAFWLGCWAIVLWLPQTPLTGLAAILIAATTFFEGHYRKLLDPALALLLIAGLTNFSI